MQPLPGQLEFVFAPNAGSQPVRRFDALLSPRVPPLRTKYEKQSQAYEKNDEKKRSETPVLVGIAIENNNPDAIGYAGDGVKNALPKTPLR